MKKIFCGLCLLIMLAGCSNSWLDEELTDETLTQEEFDQLSGSGDGVVRGLYSLLYSQGGGHDNFGQKSIDIATDIMSGDMAMTANAYGWFVDCEQRQCHNSTAGRNAYIWNYYYTILLNANSAIRSYLKKEERTDDDNAALAQSLTIRAYCYFNLAQLYSPADKESDIENEIFGGVGLNYMCVPIYNEKTYNEETGLMMEQGLSTLGDVYQQIINDLNDAILLFEGSNFQRPSKLFVNEDIANAYLAYTYLQLHEYSEAYSHADKVINSKNNYEIIPKDKVTTTGFVDVNDPSWMWGLDVTIENTGALASFWGHMDIYTYSYAYAGAPKAMDMNLYETIPESDIRKQWFADSLKCVPYKKFYDLKRGSKADEVDRRWLNDLVYMRVEEMYLIAAEAAYRNDSLPAAREKLYELVSQRDNVLADSIQTMGAKELESQIYYNWRCELWGEGRSLMTFKRFQASKLLGSNHFIDSKEIKSADLRFAVPYSEIVNNNSIKGKM